MFYILVMIRGKLYFIPQPFSVYYARFVVRTKFWANLLIMFWSNKASIISEVVPYTEVEHDRFEKDKNEFIFGLAKTAFSCLTLLGL